MRRAALWLLLFLSLLLGALVCVERFVVPRYLEHPTKCFDCEAQYTPLQAWKGQPTKCFDCEKDLASRPHGHASVFDAHPIKYYALNQN